MSGYAIANQTWLITRRTTMQHKIHMHDQMLNKVDDIMKHYKKTPVEQLLYLIKHFIKHASVQ